MRQTFLDSRLQKEFEQKGYIIFPSLLDAARLQLLRELLASHEEEYAGPFHTSHFSDDLSYKKHVHDTLAEVVFPAVARHLDSYAPLFGNFMIKNPDPNVSMDLHADWAYVDENQYRSVAVWAPLVDTTRLNGRFGVIEGSHKITNKVRGPQILQSTRDNEPLWERRYGQLLAMRAGDVVVYDHALLHFSPANKSGQPRPALNLSLAPAEGPWLHYCQPGSEIELYDVPGPDFFIHYTHCGRPQYGEPVLKMKPSADTYIDARMNSFWKHKIMEKVSNLL